MDFCLIAAVAWTDPGLWFAVLKVVIGLGLLIFVHELGHFAVAKACGVKCEKFYLGFDIAGWKLCKFTYGETEYGIGVLPLGGYVKMLGQEDNPAKLREEIERAKQQQAAEGGSPSAETQADAQNAQKETSGDDKPEPVDLAAAEQALFDPRSYLAQSVPKRMAIISAGVIMNLIFAVILAVIAFSMGVEQRPCVVGGLMPGETAWQNDIRVGDQILEIDGKKIRKFRDMQEAVSLGDDLEEGLPIKIARPGLEEPLTINVMPDSSGMIPRIGILSPSTTALASEGPLAIPGSAAARCEPPLEPGDTIVAVDDVSIEDHPELQRQMVLQQYLALHPDKRLKLTVARKAKDNGAEASAEESSGNGRRRVEIDVPVNPMRRLGLVMEMGAISAVQEGSPAAMMGIQPGDKILKIDGESPEDPLTLPERLRQRAGEVITLTISREAEADPIDLSVKLRPADRLEFAIEKNGPVSVPALGIAYPLLNRVHATLGGSPAEKAGLRNGDVLRRVTLIPPKPKTEAEKAFAKAYQEIAKPIDFDKDNRNWPVFIHNVLQNRLPDSEIELVWERQGKEMKDRLKPFLADNWFNPERGIVAFEPAYIVEKAETFGEAVRLGADETWNSTLLVYRFLQKIGSQVSPRMLGGPISIFKVAKRAADQGTSQLLIFLTLLSANLAVINFLPIPLLDGGHMVLLAWEGIRGKPADERVQLVLTYIGLFFILGLMFWVIGLDIGLISRQ